MKYSFRRCATAGINFFGFANEAEARFLHPHIGSSHLVSRPSRPWKADCKLAAPPEDGIGVDMAAQ